MSTKTVTFISLLLPATVFAQGPLTPPSGSPGPVYKTLTQVEPRTSVTNLPFTISAPGAYYLTTNLTGVGGSDGITITANDVSLDLGGFTLTGGGGDNGIASVGSQSNLRLYNGTVRNWGLAGVNVGGFRNAQIENINASGNFTSGIQSGPDTTIINCTASLNFGMGIYAGANNLVKNCAANENSSYGIQALQGSSVIDCVAGGNTNGGIYAGGSGCTISRNTARQNGGAGFIASPGTTVADNTAYLNAGHGIFALSSCTITRNQCTTNGVGAGFGAGVYCSGTDNRITENHLLSNDAGIQLDGAKNYVAGNTVQGNADNYAFVAGNELNLLLSQIPESIDWPARVDLAGSLTATASNQQGVIINANGVTFDLNGHTLTGYPGSSNGVYITSGRQGVTIMNGSLTQWNWHGVNGSLASNCTYIALQAYANRFTGLYAGYYSTFLNCSSFKNGGNGFYMYDQSTAKDCIAHDNLDSGFSFSGFCVLERCVASSQTNGTGFYMSSGNVLQSCTANFNKWGIVGSSGNSYLDCIAHYNANYGIQVGYYDRIENCSVNWNGFFGIGQASDGAHIEGNSAVGNGTAYWVTGANNFLARNKAVGSTSGTNYSIVVGNIVGAITNSAATTSPWANFSH